MKALPMNSKRLPCVRGGGFCAAKDGGVVVIYLVFVVIKWMLLQVNCQNQKIYAETQTIIVMANPSASSLRLESAPLTQGSLFIDTFTGGKQ